MITSFEIWQDFKSRVNTDQNGWFRPETDFIRALNEASMSLFNEWTAQAEKSQEIIDNLRPFSITKNITVTRDNAYFGLAPYPKEYARWGSARIIVHEDKCVCARDCECENGTPEDQEEITDEYYDNTTEWPVDKVNNQNWGYLLSHLTKRPKFPDRVKITEYEKGFKVAPRKASVLVLDYYREPKPAEFKYTITPGNPQTGSGDQLVYTPSSAPLEWPLTAKNKLLEKLIDLYIAFTRDSQLAQINSAQKPIV